MTTVEASLDRARRVLVPTLLFSVGILLLGSQIPFRYSTRSLFSALLSPSFMNVS